MNRIWAVVASCLVVLGSGCKPSSPPPGDAAGGAKSPSASAAPAVQPLLRWHLAGLQSVSKGSQGTRLKEVLALPETAVVRSNTLVKLSRNLPAMLFPEAGTNTDHSAKLKPLLEDVLTYESKVAWVSSSPLRWRVAVKIPAERTGIWTANLHDLLVRGDLQQKIPRTNITGTNFVVSYSAADTYRYGLNNGWVTVERAESGYDWAAVQMPEIQSATNRWLALDLKTELLPHVKQMVPLGNTPYASLTVEGKGEHQISRVSLRFPEPLGLKPQPWQVPTNTIQDPVISFTAVQGIDGWWSRQEWLKPLGLATAPRQAYLWAQMDVPFQTFVAVPAPGASELVRNSLTRWTNEFGGMISNRFAGRIVARTNELSWAGLPVIVPYLKAAPEPKDDHLLFGFFPMSPNSTNLPPELLQQFINRPRSIYYDWEITEARLTQWIQFSPLLFMSANRLPVANSADPYKWLRAIAPKLGNSVTEAELAGPDEIKVLRNSPVGLSGLELYLLGRWLDQAAFPGWDEQKAIPINPGVPAPLPKRN